MTAFSEFRVPQIVLYGSNSFLQIGKQAASFGKRAILISDRIMEKLGNVERALTLLDQAGVSAVTFLDVNSEPTDLHVSEALSLCLQEKCDVVVALGGGSCLDAAKAVAVLMTNGGYIGDYMGGITPIHKAPIPLLAIPTTAGTGSEATNVTVITSTSNDVKMMIKHPAFLPAVAIVDPLLTLSSPPQVTAATGVDALCHAIEAYLSKRAQPLTDVLALSAIEAIAGNLRSAFMDGTNLVAREKMAIASLQAGMAFSNASVCLVHGMSRPIGAVFHVPHGISNAMLLPAVLEFSKRDCLDRLAQLASYFNPEVHGLSQAELAEATVQGVKQLCMDLKIPNMRDYGLPKDKFELSLDKMATDALASGSPGNNPRVPTHEEIKDLYQVCFTYDFK